MDHTLSRSDILLMMEFNSVSDHVFSRKKEAWLKHCAIGKGPLLPHSPRCNSVHQLDRVTFLILKETKK